MVTKTKNEMKVKAAKASAASRRAASAERDASIVADHADGMSYSKLKAKWGLSTSTLHNIINRSVEDEQAGEDAMEPLGILRPTEFDDEPEAPQEAKETPAPKLKRERGNLFSVPLRLIDPNPWQPREQTDEEGLQELADSIFNIGLLQEPLLRQVGDRYQSAFGHRRIDAVRRLNFEGRWRGGLILARVEELTDLDMADIGVAENTKRKDISQMEVIRSWQKSLNDIPEMTIPRLAEKSGVDRTTVTHRLNLLKLPDSVLDVVHAGKMTIAAAMEFLCMVAPTHTHEDMMKRVVEDLGMEAPYFSRPPDYRLKTIRASIRGLTHGRGVRYYNTYVGGFEGMDKLWRTLAKDRVSFDVEAFKDEFHGDLHLLPEGETSGGAAYTCNVREWRRWSGRATRERNKAIEESEAAAEAPAESGEEPDDADRAAAYNRRNMRDTTPDTPAKRWLRMLRRDPVVIDVIGKARAKTLKSPAKDLSDEEREKLGTRIHQIGALPEYYEPDHVVVLPDEAYPEALQGGYVRDPKRPPGFDYSECATCTIGAAWANRRGGDEPQLVCSNVKAWTDKMSRGVDEYSTWYKGVRKAEDEEDAAAVLSLSKLITPEWGKAILLSHADFLSAPAAGAVQAWTEDRGWDKFKYYPYAAKSLANMLGIELPPVNQNSYYSSEAWSRMVNKWEFTPPEDINYALAGACVLAWNARATFGIGKPILTGETDTGKENDGDR